MSVAQKKTYTVTLLAQCTVVIEAESEDEAGLTAMNDTPLSLFSIETGEQIRELTSCEIAAHKRNADHFIAS